MSNQTGIEWTDATWNPTRGCRRVSPGCEHCYAEVIAARFSGPGLAYEGLARRRSNGEAQWTGETRFVESHLHDPITWKAPRRIFVNSMSDLFYEGFSDEEIAEVYAVMALAPRHTFQVLTKRPARARDLLRSAEFLHLVQVFVDHTAMELTDPNVRRRGDLRATAPDVEIDFADDGCKGDAWPLPNVWLGVSTENQATADERIPVLLDTPAVVRFISAEPLLAPIDLSLYVDLDGHGFRRLDWVIVGAESGPKAREFRIAWAEDIVATCDLSGVKCFVKQLGAEPITGDLTHWRCGYSALPGGEGYRLKLTSKGGDMAQWPERLRVREFPLEVTHGR
jgi:protein gp37